MLAFVFLIPSLAFVFVCDGGVLHTSNKQDNFNLFIVHFNDFHARFEPTDLSGNKCKNITSCIGGYSRLYSSIKMLKKANPNSIVLNGGDVAYGTFWYTVGTWNISADFMNKLSIDAEVLGNHEFDKKVEGAALYAKALTHPVVVANIDDALEPTLQGLYTKSYIIERGNKKIGIIGVVASNFDKLSSTGKLRFLPESPSVNAEAERLVREEGVFSNIILSHAGYWVDLEIAANASEKISIIVGGHSHTLLLSEGSLPLPEKVYGPYPTVVKSKKGHNVAVVQASAYCKIVGNISIFLDENGELEGYSGKPILLDKNISQDEEINLELNKWNEYIQLQGSTVVGSTVIPLHSTECYYKECLLGDMFTDAMLDYYSTKLKAQNTTTYDLIALINVGSLRINIEKGDITLKDLSDASPFQNSVDIGNIRGTYIKELFEFSVIPRKGYAPSHFMQISGAKVTYSMTKPQGNRVKTIKILSQSLSEGNYEDLDENRTYSLILPHFLTNGGDGFDIIKKYLSNVQIGPLDFDVHTEYLKKNSPIRDRERNRLVFI